MLTVDEAARENTQMCPPGRYDKAFKAGVTFAQEWISVEDELPEDTRTVLVRNNNYRKSVGWYMAAFQKWDVAKFDSSDIEFGTITHWRYIELLY